MRGWQLGLSSSYLHLGGLPLQKGLIKQLVQFVLILRGVHHTVCQVLEAQPAAGVGERGVVSLQAREAESVGQMGQGGEGVGKTNEEERTRGHTPEVQTLSLVPPCHCLLGPLTEAPRQLSTDTRALRNSSPGLRWALGNNSCALSQRHGRHQLPATRP